MLLGLLVLPWLGNVYLESIHWHCKTKRYLYSIHERSAREKISSSQVAHVLNDEASRKWIQSVKRLMTFAQTKYPPYTLSQIS